MNTEPKIIKNKTWVAQARRNTGERFSGLHGDRLFSDSLLNQSI